AKRRIDLTILTGDADAMVGTRSARVRLRMGTPDIAIGGADADQPAARPSYFGDRTLVHRWAQRVPDLGIRMRRSASTIAGITPDSLDPLMRENWKVYQRKTEC